MNAIDINISDNKVIVIDAPSNCSTIKSVVHDGLNLIFQDKNNDYLDTYTIDQSKSDLELREEYKDKLVYSGSLKSLNEYTVANMFEVVKVGNFYEYSFGDKLYKKSLDALYDVINHKANYQNPYVLILKHN
jgi:hypothetical protein